LTRAVAGLCCVVLAFTDSVGMNDAYAERMVASLTRSCPRASTADGALRCASCTASASCTGRATESAAGAWATADDGTAVRPARAASATPAAHSRRDTGIEERK